MHLHQINAQKICKCNIKIRTFVLLKIYVLFVFFSFRAISYNLLADLYADRDHSRAVLFPYCPPYALAIDYRKQLFLKEIMGYNADIICLQEVDTRIYHHDLVPILSNLGFDSMFAAKGGTVAEGVACFVDKKRFR